MSVLFDENFSHHLIELMAKCGAPGELQRMGAKFILLGPFWDHLGIWEKTTWLVAHWEGLQATSVQMQSGTCFLIDKLGHGKAL